MTKKPLRACLYARNSRGGRSVDDQLADGRDECTRNAWTWTEDDEFVDVARSASAYAKRARERFQEMVARIESGRYDVVVAWESSRLQRDLEVYVFLRKLCRANRVLWSLNGRLYDMDNRQDRFVTGLDALRAEDEADAIRDRNLRTIRRSIGRGWMHGETPLGFMREYDPRTGDLLRQVADPDTAPLVQEITRRVASGEACGAIAADLTARGVPTRHGAERWSATTVKVVATNPANIGKRSTYRMVTGDGAWDGIVPEDLYYRAAAVVSDPARKTTHERAIRHLLSGIAACGLCGGRMNVKRCNGSGQSYRCRQFMNVSIDCEKLDDYVEEAVLAYLERTDIAALLARRVRDGGLEEALTQAAGWDAQLNQARERVGLPDGLTPQSLAALERNLLPLIEKARNRAAALLMPASVVEMAGSEARQKWGRADVLKRRSVLKHVVRIAVNPGGRGVRTIRPGRVVLTWPLEGDALNPS